MRLVKLRFPIIVYPSEADDVGRFTAHCLNMDVLADDDTVEGAVVKLLDAIETKLDFAEDYGADPFDRAPQEYWEKIVQAEDLPPELLDRIIRDVHLRVGDRSQRIDVRAQCDVRKTELAGT